MSPLFKNLLLLKIAHWNVAADKLEEALSAHPLQECGSSAEQSMGWVPPKGKENPMVHVCQEQMLITQGMEKKLLPGTVVEAFTKARVEEIENAQGYKVGRKEKKDIKEAVTQELLPRAFVLPGQTAAWVDPVNGWFVVNTSSDAKADELLEGLRKVLDTDAFVLARVKTAMSPSQAMTDWLAGGEVPEGFTVDRDCELNGRGDEKETIRYANHSLDDEVIQGYIAEGKAVSKLAMTWNSRISFVLTDSLQIKKVEMLDVVKEGAGECDDLFDGDFALMTGEYAGLIGAIVSALGGLVEDKPAE